MSNAAIFVGHQPQLPSGSHAAFFLPVHPISLKKAPQRGAFFCLSKRASGRQPVDRAEPLGE